GIEHTYAVVMGYLAPPGIIRVHDQLCATLGFIGHAEPAGVHLRVQFVGWLAAKQMQRPLPGLRGPQPFVRGQPGRVWRAIGVIKIGNCARKQLNLTGWCAQRMSIRIIAKGFEQYKMRIRRRRLEHSVGPKVIKARCWITGHLPLQGHASVNVTKPLAFVTTFGKRELMAGFGRQFAINIEVIATLGVWLQRLLYGQYEAVIRGAADIITLE